MDYNQVKIDKKKKKPKKDKVVTSKYFGNSGKMEIDLTHDVDEEPKPKRIIIPYITEYAIKWQESLKGLESLNDKNSHKLFDRYFVLSDKLLNHPKAKMASIQYGKGGRKSYKIREPVMVNGKSLKYEVKMYGGITEKLQKTFYPDTSDNPIEKSKRNRLLGGRKPLENLSSLSLKGPCSRGGAGHGTLVHNQIEKITKMINGTGNFEYYQKQKEELDVCTESLIDTFIAKNWLPLRSEFIIFDGQMKVCSAIDILLVDIVRWKLIMVELKTGYEDEEYGPHPHDVKFEKHLQELTNCPLNRHLLQLVSYNIILSKEYDTNVDEIYIIRVCHKRGEIEIYDPLPWCNMEQFRSRICLALMGVVDSNNNSL